jgi:hypothetical protein
MISVPHSAHHAQRALGFPLANDSMRGVSKANGLLVRLITCITEGNGEKCADSCDVAITNKDALRRIRKRLDKLVDEGDG